jgi:mono/diheme cytochrome c family protein
VNTRLSPTRLREHLRLFAALVLAVCPTVASTATAQGRDALIAQGKALVEERACRSCHTIGATGTPIAPDLARVGKIHREADLARWLADPSAQRPTLHMPSLGLSESEALALAAYLTSLD